MAEAAIRTGGRTMWTALGTLLLTIMLALTPASAQAPRDAILYKDPQCGCCEAYADHLRAHGFAVTVTPSPDLATIKRRHGVPGALDLRLAQVDLLGRAPVDAAVTTRGESVK
jgi:hypothetical protein